MINKVNKSEVAISKQAEAIIQHYKTGGYIQYKNGFHILTVISDYRRADDLKRALAWCNVFFVDSMESESKSAKFVAFSLRASLYCDIKNYKDAIDDYTSAIAYDEDPKDYTIFLDRAQAYRLNGDDDKAIDDYIIAVLNARHEDHDEHIASYSFPIFQKTIPPTSLISYLKSKKNIYRKSNKESKIELILRILGNSISSYSEWSVLSSLPCNDPTDIRESKNVKVNDQIDIKSHDSSDVKSNEKGSMSK